MFEIVESAFNRMLLDFHLCHMCPRNNLSLTKYGGRGAGGGFKGRLKHPVKDDLNLRDGKII